jgi:hypothetical protein
MATMTSADIANHLNIHEQVESTHLPKNRKKRAQTTGKKTRNLKSNLNNDTTFYNQSGYQTFSHNSKGVQIKPNVRGRVITGPKQAYADLTEKCQLDEWFPHSMYKLKVGTMNTIFHKPIVYKHGLIHKFANKSEEARYTKRVMRVLKLQHLL